MIGLLPAAGTASRIGGMPKFLLPAPFRQSTLLEWHVDGMLSVCDEVLIAIRPENKRFLSPKISNSVTVIELETHTMSATVLEMGRVLLASQYLLSMPDTFSIGSDPFAQLSSPKGDPAEILLGTWKIQSWQVGTVGQVQISDLDQAEALVDKDPSCNLQDLWGMMRFPASFLKYVDVDDPHVGFAAQAAIHNGERVSVRRVNGSYFDCGTFEGYDNAYLWAAQGIV